MYSLTWLPRVLRDAGLRVVEYPGWKDRGHGDVGKIKFVICHHTATKGGSASNANEIRLVAEGRPDLPGPLSQLFLGRDGVYYMLAAGKGYHAGGGSWRGITNGNKHAIGIEAENDGVGEPWTSMQMDAYAKGVAAILKHIGADASACVAHKEWAPHRKIDPNFDMNAFRVRVAAFLESETV